MGVPSPARFFRFGAFQLDLRARELRRNGVKVRVPDQSIQVLALLLEHPGELVTREEVHQRLWPNGTIVEFDHSINAAIKRLRQALEDSAEEPKFIETLPRLGYRFTGAVEQGPAQDAAVPSDEPETSPGELEGEIVSHYRILNKLGSGGMGEVYRAKDTKLGRDVALKVLPEAFAHDAERMARFEREAQVLASLNHPHIATIYGLEESNGVRALVMELVEGPTLAECIDGRAMPLGEALLIAKQIGEGLEYAHDRGIVHRDLKPANVKLTADGNVKILDFGLAKALNTPTAQGDPSISPTLTQEGTRAGVILGTAAYMSPEQARGAMVDKRADIWAFGVVLYEMLTGKQPFAGPTVSDTLAAVLKSEPDLTQVPVQVRKLLHLCLEKDPKRRLRDMGDAWPLLDDTPIQAAAKTRLPWAVAGVLTVITIALGAALWRFTAPVETTPRPVMRLDLDLGPDASLAPTTGPSVILSPDGTRLVFVSQGSDGTRRLFTRRLDQPKAARLSGTEGAYAPFFSPDGQWVGFFAGGKLKKTRIDSSEPVTLCDAPAGRGASWGEDGNIVAALDSQVGLSQVSPEGGRAVSVTKLSLEVGENSHRWPQVLPGGKAVLFNASIAYGDYNEAAIAVVSLKDYRRKTLLEHAGMYPRYLQGGHLIYTTKGTLFAVPFDPDRLEVRGTATLLEEVSSNPNLGFAQLDFSRSGTLAYRTGGTEGLRTIQWLDGAGKTVSLGIEPARYLNPHLSPDGSRLALMVSQGSSTDLWIYDWQRGSKTRLTNGLQGAYPVWSPDGRFVVFQAAGGIFWTRADGAGQPQPLTRSKGHPLPTSFTPDGTRLAFSEATPGAGAEIRTMPVESGSGQLRAGDPQLFLKTAAVLAFPAFSPDGRWLAYADAEAGSYEVYVRAFPDKGTKVQISNAGGTMPVWSRNGHELFYRTEDQRIMAANYTVKERTFVADRPRVWFGKQLANVGLALNFDLSPDGKRFVVLMPAQSPEPRETQSHVTLALNFFDEVRRRVAAQGK